MTNWILMLIVGIISIILGIVALANPFAASMTATLIAGWSFIFLGALQIYASFGAPSTGAKIAGVLFGLLALGIGVHIVARPLEGLISLTFAAGILFLVSGALKAWFGLTGAEGRARMALLFSAAISIVLGVMVMSNFPQSAAVLLGVLLAIELISSGISAIALALIGKRVTEALS